MYEFSFGESVPGASRARDRGRGKWRFDDDEPLMAKRRRGRTGLPPIEVFDATDGLPEGDRWSTWDQSENLVPNVETCRSGQGTGIRVRLGDHGGGVRGSPTNVPQTGASWGS